jgi:hypothetical protein
MQAPKRKKESSVAPEISSRIMRRNENATMIYSAVGFGDVIACFLTFSLSAKSLIAVLPQDEKMGEKIAELSGMR